MTLHKALYILARVHTADSTAGGFAVVHKADYEFGVWRFSLEDYHEAWRIVRKAIGMQTEPDPEQLEWLSRQ